MANEATLEMIVRARDEATRTLENTQSLLRSLGGAVGGITAPFRAATSMVGGFVDVMGRVGLAAMGLRATFDAVKSLTGGLIAGNAEFERYTTQFEVLLGSAEAAKQKLEELAQFGATTPFELPEVVRASKTLQVFGGEALNSAQNLRLVGDIAAGVGRPFEDVAFWVGRLYSNLQGGRPIGEAAMALQEMGALSGEARTKLEEMAKAGASADEIFRVFAETMGEQFGGMMEKQSQTFEGMMSNLVDWWENTKRIIAEPIFDVVKENLSSLLDFLGSDTVQQGVQRFAEWLAEGIEIAMEWGRRAVAWFGENWPRIQAVGEQVFSAVREAIDRALPVIAAVIDVASDVVSYVVERWPQIRAVVSDVMGRVQEIVRSTLDQVLEWWDAYGGHIISSAVRTYEEVRARVEEYVGYAREFIGQALRAISGYWEEHGDAVIGSALEAYERAREEIEEAISFVSDVVSAGLEEARAWWEEHGDAVLATVEDVYTTVYETVADWLEEARAFVEEALSEIADYWEENGDEIIARVEDVYGTVTDVVVERMGMVVDEVRGILDQARDLWSEHGDAVQGLVGGYISTVADVYTSLVQGMATVIQDVLGMLRDWWEEHGESVQVIVEGALTLVAAIVGAYMAIVTEIWQRYGDDIIAFTEEAWERVKVVIENVLGIIGDLIDILAAVIQGDWQRVGDELVSIWERAWTIIQTVLGSAKDLVLGALRLLIDQMIAAFKSVDWGAVGRAIIDGIIAGLKAGAGAIANAAREAASAALNAAKEFLGIRSPSQAFMELGAQTVEGYVQGILQNMNAIIGAIRQTFGKVTEESAKEIKNISSMLSAAGRAMGEAIKAITAVGGVDLAETALSEGGVDKAFAVVRRMAKLLQEMNEVLRVDWVREAAKNVSDVSDEIKKAMAPFKGIVDAIQAVAELDTVTDTVGGRAEAVARRMAKLLEEMAAVARHEWVQKAAEITAEISDNIRDAMRVFKPTVDAIQAVAELDGPADTVGGKAEQVARRMAKILEEMAAVARQEWVQKAAEITASISENIRNAMRVFKPTVDAIQAVAELDPVTDAVGGKAEAVARRMAKLLQEMATVAQNEVVQNAAETAAAISDNVRDAMRMVKPAVDAIKALAEYVETEGIGTIAEQFANDLANIVATIGTVLSQISEPVRKAVEDAAEQARNIQDVTRLIKPGLGAIKELAGYTATEGIALSAAYFANDLANTVASIGMVLSQISDEVQEAVAKAAEQAANMKQVADLIKPGLSAIKGIAEYTTTEGIALSAAQFANDLANAVGTVGYVLSQISDEVQEAIADAAEQAENMRKIANLIKPGLDAIKGISEYVADADIEGKAQQFAQDLVTIAQTLASKFNESFGDMVEALGAAGDIADKINEIIAVIQPGIESLNALGEYEGVANIHRSINTFKNQLNVVVRKLQELANEYQDSLTNVTEFSQAVQEISAGIKASVDALNEVIQYRPIVDLPGRLDVFKDNLTALIGAVKQISDDTNTIAKPAADAFNAAAAAIKTSVTGAVQDLKNAITATDGVSQLAMVFRQALDAFNAFASDMNTNGQWVGRTWIEGIIRGINSKLPDLQAVLEYIRGLFPSSPAKRGPFKQLPDWSAIVQGLDVAMEMVRSSARELAGVPTPAFIGAGYGAARGGGRSMAPVVVNIHYAPGISLADRREVEERIAPIIAEALRRAQRRQL